MRYDALVARVKEAVLRSPGTTAPAMRDAIFAGRSADIPANLAAYVNTVRRHAYRITDHDVEALKQAGYSEDAIFEATGAAALGAALMRLEIGMAALRENLDPPPTDTR